jgi:hypothetical protein
MFQSMAIVDHHQLMQMLMLNLHVLKLPAVVKLSLLELEMRPLFTLVKRLELHLILHLRCRDILNMTVQLTGFSNAQK